MRLVDVVRDCDMRDTLPPFLSFLIVNAKMRNSHSLSALLQSCVYVLFSPSPFQIKDVDDLVLSHLPNSLSLQLNAVRHHRATVDDV